MDKISPHRHNILHVCTTTIAMFDQQPKPDEDLMAAYQGGDVAAFRQLLQRHEKPIFRFCLRMVRSEEGAADATQEVFLRVVRGAGKWQRQAKWTTWLYSIAHNHCVDQIRRGKFRKPESLDAPIGDASQPRIETIAGSIPGGDAVAEAADLKRVIDIALEQLPEEQRAVFLLRTQSALSFEDIATAVGVPENTAKSRMRYALLALHKAADAAGLAPAKRSTRSTVLSRQPATD